MIPILLIFLKIKNLLPFKYLLTYFFYLVKTKHLLEKDIREYLVNLWRRLLDLSHEKKNHKFMFSSLKPIGYGGKICTFWDEFVSRFWDEFVFSFIKRRLNKIESLVSPDIFLKNSEKVWKGGFLNMKDNKCWVFTKKTIYGQ